MKVWRIKALPFRRVRETEPELILNSRGLIYTRGDMGSSDSLGVTERHRAEGEGVLPALGTGESSESPESPGETSAAGTGLAAGRWEG